MIENDGRVAMHLLETMGDNLAGVVRSLLAEQSRPGELVSRTPPPPPAAGQVADV